MDTRRAMATSCRPSQRAAERVALLAIATDGCGGESKKQPTSSLYIHTCYPRSSGRWGRTLCAVSCDAVGSTTHEQLTDGAPGIAAGAGAQPAETSVG